MVRSAWWAVIKKLIVVAAVVPALALTCAQRRRSVERTPAVPIHYRELYDALDAGLDKWMAYLESRQPVPGHDVTYGAEVLPANVNRGSALLSPQALAGVEVYLDRLAAIELTKPRSRIETDRFPCDSLDCFQSLSERVLGQREDLRRIERGRSRRPGRRPGGTGHPEHHLDRGGLAGAVLPEQGEDRSGRHLQVESSQRFGVGVALPQGLQVST